MRFIQDLLAGKKTYLIAVAMSAYAVLGFLLEKETADSAARLFAEALAFASLRAGIAKM